MSDVSNIDPTNPTGEPTPATPDEQATAAPADVKRIPTYDQTTGAFK